ncbi:MAG: pyruvate kinase, partial [Cyclobacteriaceae bacterium]
ALLGKRHKHRRVRIMVTLPTEAAMDPSITDELIKRGMDCARINCAHDNDTTWAAMIRNVRKAGKKYAREIRIAMDLGGPKIRTGPIQPGPEVRRLSPKKDSFGRVISPARILFTEKLDSSSPSYAVPVDRNWLNELVPGDRLRVTDTRERDALIEIAAKTDEGILAHSYTTVYFGSDTILTPERPDLSAMRVSHIPPTEQFLRLKPGDAIILHRSQMNGEPTLYDEEGNLLQDAHLSCTFPEIFGIIEQGEKIFFDDGKIGGIVEETGDGYMKVRIERARHTGTKLKADKGINFPDLKRPLTGLTSKDREDLKFVVDNADIVNVSFVNRPDDVRELIKILRHMEAGKKLGITLKIETQEAFNNLPEILLTAMQLHPIGVMIARGDLAVEVGWDEIGRIQQEILGICNAAHVPVIWATQVLESLAKKGLPSRSEITDATQGLKAECVMLNKGPYTHRAVSLLDKIFTDMEFYQSRNEALFPPLKKA